MTYRQRIEEILLNSQGDFLKDGKSNIEIRTYTTTQLLALMDEFGEEVLGEAEPADTACRRRISPYDFETKTVKDGYSVRAMAINTSKAEARNRKKELLK